MPDVSQNVPGLAELLARIPQSVPLARNLNAVVSIRSLGAVPGDWTLTFKEGTCTVSEGRPPSANLTVEADAETWNKIIRRQLDTQWAYMSGQLRVIGDLDLAMRLQSILNL